MFPDEVTSTRGTNVNLPLFHGKRAEWWNEWISDAPDDENIARGKPKLLKPFTRTKCLPIYYINFDSVRHQVRYHAALPNDANENLSIDQDLKGGKLLCAINSIVSQWKTNGSAHMALLCKQLDLCPLLRSV
jgi:hypothetical protein